MALGFLSVLASAPASAAGPYTIHAPIRIMSDAGFTAANGVTAGDGSLSNPYVISGWEVDASTASTAGISISNTKAYFIVRNTYVHSGSSGDNCGFELFNCTHVRIENCTANSCRQGIFAASCHDMTITGCYAANNIDAGIFVELCYTNITVSNNEVCHNRHGIYNNDAWNTMISNNRVHNNSQYGIIMTVGSVSVRVVSNQVADNGAGVTVNLWSNWIPTDEIFIYHNQILRNTVQASDNNLGHTHWDDGYPSGGNFWSDYAGVDLYSGPEQNILGPDGIGDTPYPINPTPSDRYPLMQPTNNPPPPPPQGNSTTETTYRVYDMFQEPWHEWWNYRYPTYRTDIILTNTPGNYTMLYNPDKNGYQGIIWAPYRMNITATNLTDVTVHQPEFMPVLDSTRALAGANATIDVYFEYLYWDWWNNTWAPRWHNDPSWFAGSMNHQTNDGWYLGVQYNVTMNREAAQEWLRLPVTAPDVAAWWAANASSYKAQWTNWLLNEGNNRLDIFNGYEFPMMVTGPYANLIQLPNGDVRLELDHVSWGYEVLMNRWLMEKQISSHQPNLENFTMSAKLSDKQTSLTLDTVCQYNLRAVKANQSAGTGAAWAFEPVRADYIWPSMSHPHSDYAPFEHLTYQSWYAGDPWFGTENSYAGFDTTPGYFNLTKTEALVFELPKHDQVICYEGRGVGPDAINNITWWSEEHGAYPNGGDFTEYNNLIHHGSMSLGFSITNLGSGTPLDLNSMYDPVSKTLTIKGPHNFDNSGRGEGNPLYHGAPWIEFNVGQDTQLNTPPVASFNHTPVSGEVGTIFTFDASECYDGQDPTSLLNVRWDWESDGVWDTPWSTTKTATHSYGAPGVYAARLEVMDSGGLTDETYRMVRVIIPPPTEPGAIINVSYATSVTIWEETGPIDSYDFDINSLMDSGGGFYTSAEISEFYLVTSDGIYLTIDCYRDPPTYPPVWGAGGNIVAARLNGVPGYPNGLFASIVVSSLVDSKGVPASVYNALGPDTQLGPYNNMYATLLGDNHTEIVLGFSVPGSVPRPINATVNFDMDTFNPASKGNWVSAYIDLPTGYSVRNINVSTVRLNGVVPANGPSEIKDFDHDKVLELLVKFDRKAALGTINVGKDVFVIVTGSLMDGTKFQGTDKITVLAKSRHTLSPTQPAALSAVDTNVTALLAQAMLPLSMIILGACAWSFRARRMRLLH